MSLGLVSDYGTGSDSDNSEDEEHQIQGVLVKQDKVEEVKGVHDCNSDNTSNLDGVLPSGESVMDRLKNLAGEAVEMPEDIELALSMPPPPPPSALPPATAPLPNPLKQKKSKQRLPAIGRREMEMLKTAQWTHITTSEVSEEEKTEFEYNTPLPFNISGQGNDDVEEENVVVPQPAEYDYVSYVAEYQNYLANSATLLDGQAKSQAEGGSSTGSIASALDPDYKSPHSDEWNEYMEKYSEWYAQYGSNASGVAAPSAPPTQIRQKTFEELVEQDRQLKAYFESAPANEYNSQRDAFKSSFRGTRMYRMRNGNDKYNPKHFNQLSQGAKAFAAMYPKQKSVFVDKDAYIADKDLPENQDPKSLKQRKKDKWFERMKKKGGCKKCGYVFCRCYGWEYKPSHVK